MLATKLAIHKARAHGEVYITTSSDYSSRPQCIRRNTLSISNAGLLVDRPIAFGLGSPPVVEAKEEREQIGLNNRMLDTKAILILINPPEQFLLDSRVALHI